MRKVLNIDGFLDWIKVGFDMTEVNSILADFPKVTRLDTIVTSRGWLLHKEERAPREPRFQSLNMDGKL